MARDPVIRRLTLIPSGTDEAVRRWRLAQLDEVALASPPYELPEGPRRADKDGLGAEPKTEPEGEPPR